MQRRYQQGFQHNIPWYPKLWQLRQHPRSQDTNSYHQQSLWESQLKKKRLRGVRSSGKCARFVCACSDFRSSADHQSHSLSLRYPCSAERAWEALKYSKSEVENTVTKCTKTNDACAVWTHVPNSPCSCARNWPTQIDLCVFQNRTWKRMKICTSKSLLMRRDLTCCPNTQRRQI